MILETKEHVRKTFSPRDIVEEGEHFIHFKNTLGLDARYEFNDMGKPTYIKVNDFEEWAEYDTNGNMTHYKNSNGYEGVIEYYDTGEQLMVKMNEPDTTVYYSKTGYKLNVHGKYSPELLRGLGDPLIDDHTYHSIKDNYVGLLEQGQPRDPYYDMVIKLYEYEHGLRK